MSQTKRVDAIQAAGMTGYDKSLDSKCKRPEKYGIQRTAAAENAIHRKAEHRTKSARISHRLQPDRLLQVQAAVNICGYGTVQAWLDACVRRLLIEAKRKAPADVSTIGKGAKKNNLSSDYNESEDLSNGI
ncbi:MAG: hypothetical protein RSF70_09835 [Ruthenibacterium sp.]